MGKDRVRVVMEAAVRRFGSVIEPAIEAITDFARARLRCMLEGKREDLIGILSE